MGASGFEYLADAVTSDVAFRAWAPDLDELFRVAGDATTAGELKAYCLAHGAAYAHPRRIAFIDAFPVATTGKVDRRAIRDMLAGSGGAA